MIIPTNTTVYCDANFLVAYGAKQTKQPEIQKRAQILFAKLLSKNCKIAASPLSFDEAWDGVRREAGPKKVKSRTTFFLNKIFNKFGVFFKNSGVIKFSFSDVLGDIKNFTKNLLSSSKFIVVQFPTSQEKIGVNQSLDNMNSFKLKPHDAFHLSIMQLNNVQYIVTKDEKIKRTGINVVSF